MTMILRVVLALSMMCVPVAAGPADGVADRFQNAIEFLDSGGFHGSYTVVIASRIAKENGSSEVLTDMEMNVRVDADGKEHIHLVRSIADGKDRTEKDRKDVESSSDEDDDELAEDEDFLLPFGDDSDRFIFGEPLNAGDHVEMTFEPTKKHQDDQGMAKGLMVWHSKTLDPVRLEVEVLKPEKPLRELKLQMDFARVGDVLYMNRMVTDGKVKVLLMKRNFHMDMTVSALKAQ